MITRRRRKGTFDKRGRREERLPCRRIRHVDESSEQVH